VTAAAQKAPTLGTSTRDAPVVQMFADLAPDYDRMNALITFGLADSWRRELVRRAAPAGRCLDLGCGTGDLTDALLADPAARVTGFDLTRAMLQGARARLRRAGGGERARLVQGDAEQLPFSDRAFDTVVSSFLMRNVGDRPSAYREVARVLKPGGRFLQLELAKPESPLFRAAFLLYFRHGMPRLAALFSPHRDSFQYLAESIDRWPQPAQVGEEIKGGGFASVEQVRELFGGVALHIATKRGPTV
jgi:demethylmenaquinone methyltransferase/2-methoxy-6-polyprenyl-1,4-benzoquinol methylase